MSKKRSGRTRQLARPSHYGRGHLLGKQAGTVEEALRHRGIIAHVKTSCSGRSPVVQVADPDAQTGYLDVHAEALDVDGCHSGGLGRQITTTPVPQSPAAQGAKRRRQRAQTAPPPLALGGRLDELANRYRHPPGPPQ